MNTVTLSIRAEADANDGVRIISIANIKLTCPPETVMKLAKTLHTNTKKRLNAHNADLALARSSLLSVFNRRCLQAWRFVYYSDVAPGDHYQIRSEGTLINGVYSVEKEERIHIIDTRLLNNRYIPGRFEWTKIS